METITEKEQPLVSVIIPTYNRSSYLKDAISSALKQTYQNIEVIVSDDCSPNSPESIVSSFQDLRIKFWVNDKNLGMFRNTINAFRQAKGKYVASLNDDDMWNPDFLEKMIPPLETHSELALSFCDHYVVDSNGVIDEKLTKENSKRWKREQLDGGVYQPFYKVGLVNQSVSIAAAAVIRREAVDWDNMPDEAGVYWDQFTMYMACRTGKGAYYVPERLTRYRVHEQSETATSGGRSAQAKLRKAKAGIYCYGTFMRDERLKEYKAYFTYKWSHANTSLGIALLRLNRGNEARPYLFESLKNKFSARTLMSLILSFIPLSVSKLLLKVD